MKDPTLGRLTERLIHSALTDLRGNFPDAAAALGISLPELRRRVEYFPRLRKKWKEASIKQPE